MKVIGFLIVIMGVWSATIYADIFSYELTCSKIPPSKLVSFFNQDIKDKIIDVTPDFCLDKPKNSPKDKIFNTLFTSLAKRAKNITHTEFKENDPYLVMKSLLLNRLWGQLTNKQRHLVFGNRACTQNREIYHGFMEFKDEKPVRKSEKAFETYQEICALSNFEKLIPYLDKGLLLEYFFVVNLAKLNFNSHHKQFCESLKASDEHTILGSRAVDVGFNYSKFKKNTEWMIKTDIFNKDSYRKELTDFSSAKKVNRVFMDAIGSYTAASYVDINNCLRDKSCQNDSIEQIMQIKKGLNAIKRKEMITYRGVSRLPDSVERKLRTNCVFSDPAFLSTSLRYEVARSFLRSDDGYMLVIRGKSGALIQGMSTIREEEEVLYPNGTKFVVVGMSSYFETDTKMEIKTVYLRELEPFEKAKDCSGYDPKTDDGT